MHGDVFRDADNEWDLCFDGLFDCRGGEGCRDEDGCCVRVQGAGGFADCGVDGEGAEFAVRMMGVS
jgi:hypothetical protein